MVVAPRKLDEKAVNRLEEWLHKNALSAPELLKHTGALIAPVPPARDGLRRG